MSFPCRQPLIVRAMYTKKITASRDSRKKCLSKWKENENWWNRFTSHRPADFFLYDTSRTTTPIFTPFRAMFIIYLKRNVVLSVLSVRAFPFYYSTFDDFEQTELEKRSTFNYGWSGNSLLLYFRRSTRGFYLHFSTDHLKELSTFSVDIVLWVVALILTGFKQSRNSNSKQ